MNIRQMQYIIEIAKEGNITTAANNLFISQPSLSSLLANVEKELGAKLFDRSTAPIVLTYAGEKYIEAATKILRTINELQYMINDMQESVTGRLRVGCSTQQSPFFVPVIMSTIVKRYPGVQLQLTEDSPGVLEKLLLNGTLDVILCGESVNHPNFVCLPMKEEETVLLAPTDRAVPTIPPLDGEKRFPCANLRTLNNAPFVLMKKKHQLRKMQDRILEENDCKPDIILETSNWQTCLRMVTSGMAFTFLPYVESEIPVGQICLYSLPQKYHRRTFLFYRKNTYCSKALDAFIAAAQNIFMNKECV
jgi:DNA-binding transcriptional LysR family regulator